MSSDEKRNLIIPCQKISIARQCDLVGLSRSTFYYEPCKASDWDLKLMSLIDEEFTRHPFYGSRRLAAYLASTGNHVCRDKVRALMQKMGIQAIYPKPRLSVRNPDHVVYPYLLRGMNIVRVNQVWSTDITYIRMRAGFLYLVAVLDWFSRYVLAWRLSNSLEGDFCREVVHEALKYGRPDIFNVDQGPQFTCRDFVELILSSGMRLSMDGKGRCIDNIFAERLWRTVKYEEVYIKDYKDGLEAHDSLLRYFKFYNNERLHQSLDYIAPSKVYFEGC